MTGWPEKNRMRATALRVRKKAHENDQKISGGCGSTASTMLKEKLAELFDFWDFGEFKVVSSYYSVKSEISVILVNEWLRENGYIICLPSIEEEYRPLKFYEWDLTSKLILGKFNIPVPPSDNLLDPDILLCPLISFDLRGNRLGYGGGYYDRTIEELRNRKRVKIIGLGYSQQKVKTGVPIEKHDQKLDAMVTDEEFLIFN